MNKILIDTRNYNLDIKESGFYLISVFDKDTDLVINNYENTNSTVNLLVKNSHVKIIINSSNNSFLTINQLGVNSSIENISNLKLGSSLRYVLGIISNTCSINNFKINHQEKFSNSSFILSGINAGCDKFYFNIDGKIDKNANNSTLDYKSKIINLMDGDSKIIPNLLVNNNDVVANHSAFIGSFNKEDIWYLNSRGINQEGAYKLLLKSTLLGFMNLEGVSDKFIKFLMDNINI